MLRSLAGILEEVRKTVPETTCEELKRRLDAGEKIVLVDVREPEEWRQGVLPGAQPVPRGLLELQLPRFVRDPEAPIVVYCAGGIRSLLAAEALQRLGYGKVESLAGGFADWARGKGYPVKAME
jgi:rhodanese-related sulfurtransferase